MKKSNGGKPVKIKLRFDAKSIAAATRQLVTISQPMLK